MDCGGAGDGGREIPGGGCHHPRSDDGGFDARDSNGDGMRWMGLRYEVHAEPPSSLTGWKSRAKQAVSSWVSGDAMV